MEVGQSFIDALKLTGATDESSIQSCWSKLVKAYSSSSRHYHNLNHLEHMLHEMIPLKDRFDSWPAAVLALAFHDAVYQVTSSNNEERSAALARRELSALGVEAKYLQPCERLILATKRHEAYDASSELFVDADLSILGSDPATYERYVQSIRQEYWIFPDFMYRKGRKKVLEHFIRREQIFYSDYFSARYEVAAKRNLSMELSTLS